MTFDPNKILLDPQATICVLTSSSSCYLTAFQHANTQTLVYLPCQYIKRLIDFIIHQTAYLSSLRCILTAENEPSSLCDVHESSSLSDVQAAWVASTRPGC